MNQSEETYEVTKETKGAVIHACQRFVFVSIDDGDWGAVEEMDAIFSAILIAIF